MDELSSEAMLESSERIELLAEVYRHRQEPLSEPGPPQPLPGKPRAASWFFQIIAIILLVYYFISTNFHSIKFLNIDESIE